MVQGPGPADLISGSVSKPPAPRAQPPAYAESDFLSVNFRRPVQKVLNLRTGKSVQLAPDGRTAGRPDGRTVRAGRWNPWEALLLEVTVP